MIALTEYAKIIGRDNRKIGDAIRNHDSLKRALEGHISYGKAANGKSRAIYLDENGVDILDAWYGIVGEKINSVPVHIAVETTPEEAKKTVVKKKTPTYKRQFDTVQKKLVDALEVQNSLRAEIINLQTELAKVQNEMSLLQKRSLWQRIINEGV